MVATLLIAVAGMVTISAIVAGAILSCCDGAECGGEDGGGQGRLGGADGLWSRCRRYCFRQSDRPPI